MVAVALTLGGLALLWSASGAFVTGAVRLAARLRMSPIVIGAVVVGFGTSLPEALVSGLAAAQGLRQIAIGNVVGSNLANVTLILGVLGLLAAPRVRSETLRQEIPLATAAVVMFAVILQKGLTILDGLVLLAGLVAIVIALTRIQRSAGGPVVHGPPARTVILPVEAVRVAAGLGGTMLGAHLLIRGASQAAEALGLAEGFVGLTIVAVGTSLPELAASVQAVRRNAAELALGNILGSNLFNSFGIGGLIALIDPGPAAPELSGTAAGAMVIAAVATGLLLWTGRRLQRWEAILLLAGYAVVLFLARG